MTGSKPRGCTGMSHPGVQEVRRLGCDSPTHELLLCTPEILDIEKQWFFCLFCYFVTLMKMTKLTRSLSFSRTNKRRTANGARNQRGEDTMKTHFRRAGKAPWNRERIDLNILTTYQILYIMHVYIYTYLSLQLIEGHVPQSTWYCTAVLSHLSY